MDGFLQLLADQVADDSRARYYVEMLSSELGHLEQLVEDSLHFTRVGTIPFSRCDLAAILNQIATKVAHLAEGERYRSRGKSESLSSGLRNAEAAAAALVEPGQQCLSCLVGSRTNFARAGTGWR